jgi:antitoxin VapB
VLQQGLLDIERAGGAVHAFDLELDRVAVLQHALLAGAAPVAIVDEHELRHLQQRPRTHRLSCRRRSSQAQAARRGTSVTDAVRQALRAALEREPDLVDPLALQAKREAIEHICQRFRDLPLRDGRRPQELRNDLYDAQGLPV